MCLPYFECVQNNSLIGCITWLVGGILPPPPGGWVNPDKIRKGWGVWYTSPLIHPLKNPPSPWPEGYKHWNISTECRYYYNYRIRCNPKRDLYGIYLYNTVSFTVCGSGDLTKHNNCHKGFIDKIKKMKWKSLYLWIQIDLWSPTLSKKNNFNEQRKLFISYFLYFSLIFSPNFLTRPMHLIILL